MEFYKYVNETFDNDRLETAPIFSVSISEHDLNEPEKELFNCFYKWPPLVSGTMKKKMSFAREWSGMMGEEVFPWKICRRTIFEFWKVCPMRSCHWHSGRE